MVQAPMCGPTLTLLIGRCGLVSGDSLEMLPKVLPRRMPAVVAVRLELNAAHLRLSVG